MTADNEAYDFVLVASGGGPAFPIGRGTLAEGRALIEKMEREFEEWEAGGYQGANPAHEFWEGCDIYAEQAGEPKFYFDDDWREF